MSGFAMNMAFAANMALNLRHTLPLSPDRDMMVTSVGRAPYVPWLKSTCAVRVILVVTFVGRVPSVSLSELMLDPEFYLKQLCSLV